MEVHEIGSLKYSEYFIYNNYNAVIGLSATINRKTEYICEDGSVITKGELIDRIAPICFKYTVNDGQLDGTSRKLVIHVINHKLDNTKLTVTAGSKLKPFMQTEQQAYTYWNNELKKAMFMPESIKAFKITTSSAARARILYNLQSKIEPAKKLLASLEDKTIVFGNSIVHLLQITKNVISSKNTEKMNEKIRADFDEGKIKIIGSFKMLQQGANLNGLDNVVIVSYYSVEKQLIQMAGRMRLNGTKDGQLFIFVTEDTAEVKWFAKMTEEFKEFEFVQHDNIDNCIEYVKNKEKQIELNKSQIEQETN